MNNWQLSGRLGKDAEIRNMDNGKQVINLLLATDESRKDQSGQWVKETLWTNVSWFGGSSAIVPFLKKGSVVFVEGKPKARHYNDKNNNFVDVCDMTAFRVEVMSFAKDETQNNQQATQQAETTIPEPIENLPF